MAKLVLDEKPSSFGYNLQTPDEIAARKKQEEIAAKKEAAQKERLRIEEERRFAEELASAKKRQRIKVIILLLALISVILLGYLIFNHASKNQTSEVMSKSQMPELKAEAIDDVCSCLPSEDSEQTKVATMPEMPLDLSEENVCFIKRMYEKELYNDYDFLESYCSKSLLTKLADAYEYDGGGYAGWEFRSGQQDGPNNEHRILSIEDLDDGWYKYTALDMGNLFTRYIKLSRRGNNAVIEDVSGNPICAASWICGTWSYSDWIIISEITGNHRLEYYYLYVGKDGSAAYMSYMETSAHVQLERYDEYQIDGEYVKVGEKEFHISKERQVLVFEGNDLEHLSNDASAFDQAVATYTALCDEMCSGF